MLESGIRFLPEGCLADAVIVVVFLFVSNARLRLGLEGIGGKGRARPPMVFCSATCSSRPSRRTPCVSTVEAVASTALTVDATVCARLMFCSNSFAALMHSRAWSRVAREGHDLPASFSLFRCTVIA